MFPLLKGGSEDVVLHILSFLTPQELSENLVINHAAAQLISSELLWKHVYRRDFGSPQEGLMGTTNDVMDTTKTHRMNYTTRLRDIQQMYHDNFIALQIIEEDASSYHSMACIQNCIDLIQLRCMLPFPLVCAFISTLLIALRMDGYDEIPAYACYIPLFATFLYLLVALSLTAFMNAYKASCTDLWDHMSGPFRVLYSTRIAHSLLFSSLLFYTVAASALQVILIALKLSALLNITWALIFLPLWTLFLLFCLLPGIHCIDMALYCTGIILWVPLFIFFVCLTCKLHFQENNISINPIYLAEILIPFWLIQAAIMLWTCVLVGHALCNLRARVEGARDYFLNSFSICSCSWCFLLPLLLFQMLISVKDVQNSAVTAVACVVPLLIFIGFLLIWALVFVCLYSTPYEESRAARAQRDIGKHVVFKV